MESIDSQAKLELGQRATADSPSLLPQRQTDDDDDESASFKRFQLDQPTSVLYTPRAGASSQSNSSDKARPNHLPACSSSNAKLAPKRAASAMSSKRTSKSANSRTGTYIAAPEQSLLDAGPSTSQLPLVPARFQPMMSGQGGAKRTMEDAELEGEDDEEEEEEGVKGKNANKRNATSTGRRKISIQYIDDKSKRHVSFTKRKSGLMKKVRCSS